jgi:DEAD/DEAH box helicase domain-containing protein
LVHDLRESLAPRTGHTQRRRRCTTKRLPARKAVPIVLRPAYPIRWGGTYKSEVFRQLYAHQVETIQAARAGRNVVITTPTESGKSMAFNLPILEKLLEHPSRHALFPYPTKALMADQLRALETLVDATHLARPPRIAVLSGDVTAAQGEQLCRDPPAILLANPGILHFDMLRQHHRWRDFLAGLDYLVLDELHDYRGVFGSHVALILRRLRRVAALYGALPACIAASATIANPKELAEQLAGLPFSQVDGNGAGAGPRRFLFWRPPLRGATSANQHQSVAKESVGLFVELLRQGRSVILFGRSRLSVERMFADALGELGPAWGERISAYKSGYLVHERERIEAGLREGHLRGVVTTNATRARH